MLISVIIPVFNASPYLPRCLEAMSSQTFTDAEYLFIDNSSSDSSRELVEKFIEKGKCEAMKLYVEEKRGASAARNKGAAMAGGEWLVFTDSDCIPDENWLSDLVSEMGNDELGAIAGSVHPAPTSSVIGRFLGIYTLPANQKKQVYDSYTLVGGGFPTANFAVRKDIFREVGGFDEDILIYGEDHDLCDRIYRAGYKIAALQTAKVQHIHREDLGALVKQTYGFGQAHALMLARIKGGSTIIAIPLINKVAKGSHKRIWIDLNQADKKLAIALLTGIINPILFLLPFFYFIYLCVSTFQKGNKKGVVIKALELPTMVILLIIKSAALTLGRLAGSFKYNVVCI